MLCRVGPGTPMGELFREYWLPALPSSEFPTPDSPPKRMRLLGENLVMFRDSNGRMGALAEACPHRGASLYFGRNEECGLRCAYHGWKFDVNGNCVDLPTEQQGSRFREYFQNKVKATAYRCRDVNHMVWIYMGTRETPPPFPEFETNTLPSDHVAHASIMMEEANWLQNMEGDLDSAHLDWVHRRLHRDAPAPEIGMPGFWNPDPNPPVLDVVPTEYGAYYSAARTMDDGQQWHRINQFIFPCFTMISIGHTALVRSFVPLDDHHAMLISQFADPVTAIPEEQRVGAANTFDAFHGFIERTNDPGSYFMTVANKRNDYLRDMELQQERLFFGVPFVGNLQDRAMTELMCGDNGEPIYDRTKEHLGSSDQMVSAVRKQLLEAVRKRRHAGELPANLDDPGLDRVRAATMLLPADSNWRSESEKARIAEPGRPAAYEVPLIMD
jgi:phenylpropionate dioxygenase-like ring-hydroxylating dioxygenase large terminal subunit